MVCYATLGVIVDQFLLLFSFLYYIPFSIQLALELECPSRRCWQKSTGQLLLSHRFPLFLSPCRKSCRWKLGGFGQSSLLCPSWLLPLVSPRILRSEELTILIPNPPFWFRYTDVLYKRLVLGEPQRKLPRELTEENRSVQLGGAENRRAD